MLYLGKMTLIINKQHETAGNESVERIFHMSAFSGSAEVQIVIFVGVLIIYITAVLANLFITVLVCVVPQLHTPMYFFLCNLAITDILYVSAILPKLLAITITGNNTFSFTGCMVQLYIFLLCATMEVILLTCMAYDRYVAICIPLNYPLIMSQFLCIMMAASCWLFSCIYSLYHTLYTSLLSFDYVKEINHFFCDLNALLMFSSSDTKVMDICIFVEDAFVGFLPFLCIITSYTFIISTILKISSSDSRLKAISSCASHLSAVIMSYGISLSLYAKPKSEHMDLEDKLLSVLYVAIVPMLNPLVYSLRNRDVLQAMKKLKKMITLFK